VLRNEENKGAKKHLNLENPLKKSKKWRKKIVSLNYFVNANVKGKYGKWFEGG